MMSANAVLPISADPKLILESAFENQDEHCEDLQPTEVDLCLPLTAPVTEIKPTHEGLGPDPLPNATTPKSKISVTKANGRIHWPGGEFEGRIRKRYGLNHEGYIFGIVLIAFLFLLVTVIIILSALWPKTPHSHLFPVCTKAACLRASSVILPSIDSSVAPCVDLYGYACGGFLQRHKSPPLTRPRWGAAEERALRRSENTRDAISTLPHPTMINSVTWKTKYFYDSCMALDNIETDKERPLKKIINELGGFKVLREFVFLAWDFKRTLVQLQAEYGVSSFFQVRVIADPTNSSRSILELSPSPLGLPDVNLYKHTDDKVPTCYRTFMKDSVQLLGANSLDAKGFSDDIFFFERRIAENLPTNAELNDIHKHQVHNISHLKTIAPSVPIHEIVSALFPSASIGDNTRIIVRSTQYIQSLSNVISTTDRSALNNYLMWQLTNAFLPYLSQDFLNIQFTYLRDTTGVKNRQERWEFCSNALLRFQSLGVAARLEKYGPEDSRSEERAVVEKMFDTLRAAVKESVLKAEWVDLELYQHIAKKLDSMRIHVGLPNKFLEDVYLDKFYEKLFVQKNDFFQNILYGLNFLQKSQERRYVEPRPEYTWIEKMADLYVSYEPASNSLLVPNGLLREPLFHVDYPPGLLYGGLGVYMAEGIISGILPPLGLYAANGTRIPISSLVANLSQTCLGPQLACLAQNNTFQGFNSFLTISALRQSFKALKKVVKESPHIHQPGLEDLEDHSLLVLKFAQEQCIVQSPQDLALQEQIETPLRGIQLLNVVKNNLKSLTEVFGCSSSATPCKHIL